MSYWQHVCRVEHHVRAWGSSLRAAVEPLLSALSVEQCRHQQLPWCLLYGAKEAGTMQTGVPTAVLTPSSRVAEGVQPIKAGAQDVA